MAVVPEMMRLSAVIRGEVGRLLVPSVMMRTRGNADDLPC